MNRESHQAFTILRFGFTVAPVVAGLDKFLHLLTNWDKYLAPGISNALGIAPHTFMTVVGAVEIAAGLLVAWRPRWGAYVVAAWLIGIIGNLVVTGGYLDVALRDLGLCLGALALARLAQAEESVGVPTRA
ncbi:MAG: hypothetical protein M3167_03365 [Acidobacteriota bacterium]|nr:hypothetical protein [Acidobacteriota bacterium]